MDPLYEMSFRPADDLERRAFEDALHDFVAREAGKPEASSVFAEFDSLTYRWVLGFETQAALKAFGDFWRDRAGRSGSSRPEPVRARAPRWSAPTLARPHG